MVLRPSNLLTALPKPEVVRVIPSLALKSVTAKNGGGVYASSDTLFKSAIFGRDSLEVAEDLISIRPRLVRNILLTLAALQGHVNNPANEEEPGKIIHEYRTTVVGGRHITGTPLEIFRALAKKWGGNETEMAYYGSIDATPHFIRVLHTYTKLHGQVFLNRSVRQRNGETTTMRVAVDRAMVWLLQKLHESRTGLLEYQRHNAQGIENQVWKDSLEFYVHENGEFANHNAPIASIEVQGLVYDALLAAGDFIPERAATYHALATKLRDRTIELLWQEDRQAFALGTDFDELGGLRIIRTPTANPAELLDTHFFDDLSPPQRQKFITAIVEQCMENDFLTDAGLRSRALSAAHVVGFWDYHGSYVSWPKETYDAAKGLYRQGLPALGRQLENRILNIYLKNRDYPEFVYVDKAGRVLASAASQRRHDNLITIDSNNKPEHAQAWTVSAVTAILVKRYTPNLRPKKAIAGTWQAALENSLLSRMHKVDIYVNPFALSARYPTYQYQLSKKPDT